MKYLFYLFLAIFVIGCSGYQINQVERAVHNGRVATKDEFYSTVSLARSKSNPLRSRCTGTVIAPRLVLTAAHCVTKGEDVVAMDASELKVIEQTLDIADVLQENVFEVEEVIPHPNFPNIYRPGDERAVGQWDDIALLITKEELKTPPIKIYPISMFDSLVTESFPVTLSGYGETEEGIKGVLHIGESVFNYRSDFEMWIGSPEAATTCIGDSGGPVYIRDEKDNMYVIGITSRFGRGTWCENGSIFTLAPAYEWWIRQNSQGLYPYYEQEASGYAGGCNASGHTSGFTLFIFFLILFMLYRRRPG